jgi:hypothetical protein
MPPNDPRLRPALERSLPADAVPGGEIRYARGRWLVLFGDGDWHPVQVRAWRKDRAGRDVADVEWSIAGETWGESYQVDKAKMREG